MKRKQINRGKKWLVAVLPPTTFVTITNQKCQLYQYHLGRQVICTKLLQYRSPEYPASGTADRLEFSGLVFMIHVIELLPCK